MRVDVGMLRETFERWNADKAPRLAAALSFTTIFAIAPVLIIVIAISGTIIAATVGHGHGHSVVRDQLLNAIRASAGRGAGDAVNAMVDAAFNKPRQSVFAQIFGWVMLVAGAAGLFAALQDALNTVWHVVPPKKGLWVAVRDRLASVGMLLAIGFLLLVSTAINAAIAYVSTYVTQALPFAGAGIAFAAVNWIVSIVVVMLLFAMMFKYLPDAAIAWGDVWTGALVTAVAFVVGQAVIALYLGRAGVASAYGAAGSLVVLLLWVYYSSMILLFGAEFTRVYAERHGSRIGAGDEAEPPGAVPVTSRGSSATATRSARDVITPPTSA